MSRNSFLTDILSTIFERRWQFSSETDERPLKDLCLALLSNRGEISGHKITLAILERVTSLDEEAALAFFKFLTDELDLDTSAIASANEAYQQEASAANLARLNRAAEPRRQELFRRINQVPGATAVLVRLRERLLKLIPDNPSFKRTDLDFQHLFSSWFNRGFLVLRRIQWDSPASILEKIIRYEAVHAINDWEELRQRVGTEDRRCYAFFHPAMPDDPLIFVEVALCNGIPSSVQSILSDTGTRPAAEVDTAAFYSISNCQAGLRGVSFGNFLIKQVVEDLKAELPDLATFVTLSPIPGFVSWLESAIEPGSAVDLILRSVERGEIDLATEEILARKEEIRSLAAWYLHEEKDKSGLPLDPVARFHINNGASLLDLHILADRSENGIGQSLGTMVNYHYDLKRVEQNHEAYASNGVLSVGKPFRAALNASTKQMKSRKLVDG